MRLAFLIVLLLLVFGAIGGFVYVGLFPPAPRTHSVDRVVPNDQLQTH